MTKRALTGEVLTVRKPRHLGVTVIVGAMLFAFVLLIMGTARMYEGFDVAGHLEPVGGMSKLYAKSAAQVITANVRAGQQITRGQLIYVLQVSQSSSRDPNIQASILGKLNEKQQLLRKELAALQAQATLEESIYHETSQRLQKQLSLLNSQRTVLAQESAQLKSLYDTEKSIYGRHLISIMQLSSALSDYHSSLVSTSDVNLRISDLGNQLQDAAFTFKRNDDALRIKILDTEASLTGVSQQILGVEATATQAVRAPMNGTIGYLASQPGETVRAGELIATVVPNSDVLVAAVSLSGSAIGKVKVGDPVKIRYAAFPYMQYGLFSGSVASIAMTPSGAPAVTGAGNETGYAAVIHLDDQTPTRDGTKLRLRPGALLHATVITGHASILHMLFAPVFGLRTAAGT